MSRVSDLVSLTKPRLNALTVFAVAAGYLACSGAPREDEWARLAVAVAGSALCAGGAAAVNQAMERGIDARMVRTAGRAVAAGRISPADAYAFGWLLSGAGIAALALGANALTGALGAICVGTYVGIYTPLKRVTTLNTLVGTVPGALPPVMGVAAATGRLGAEAVFLFALLVAWQLPHFLSIAFLHREDYRRGGLVMLPCVEGGEDATARQAVTQSLLALVASVAAVPFGLAGRWYALTAFIAGAAFVAAAVVFALRRTEVSARTLLRASLVHLPLVLTAFALDRVPT